MELYYCDECGKRLPSAEPLRVAATVRENGEPKLLCEACAAAQQDAAAPQALAPGSQRKTPAARPTTALISKRATTAAVPRPRATGRADSTAKAPSKPNPNLTIGVGLGVGGAIFLGAILYLLTGNSKQSKVAETEKSATQTATESASVISTPVAPVTPAAPPKTAETLPPSPRPSPPVPDTIPEPPVTGAGPTPPPTISRPPPSANETERREPPKAASGEIAYGPWENLIKNNSLDGWEFYKGKWEVIDGAIVATESLPKGATIQSTDKNWANFELQCQIELEVANAAELQVRSYGVVFLLELQRNKWHDLALTANGPSARATVDGQEVSSTGEGNGGQSGDISFYVRKGGRLKIKELKVRRILSK